MGIAAWFWDAGREGILTSPVWFEALIKPTGFYWFFFGSGIGKRGVWFGFFFFFRRIFWIFKSAGDVRQVAASVFTQLHINTPHPLLIPVFLELRALLAPKLSRAKVVRVGVVFFYLIRRESLGSAASPSLSAGNGGVPTLGFSSQSGQKSWNNLIFYWDEAGLGKGLDGRYWKQGLGMPGRLEVWVGFSPPPMWQGNCGVFLSQGAKKNPPKNQNRKKIGKKWTKEKKIRKKIENRKQRNKQKKENGQE